MTILVTGGAGFLGSHLARALQARGARVRVLDDLSTGYAANLPETIPLQRGDVRAAADVEAALRGVEQVYHLAAAVGPSLVAADPRGTWSRNAGGTWTVLRACVRRRIPVLLASSSEVYHPDAADAGVALAESTPTGTRAGDRRAVYARSKLVGEAAGLRLARAGLPVVVARLFNVVGTRQSPRHGMVLARLADAARRGAPLPVYGDGAQRRCFLHVKDAVRALMALVEAPGAVARAVNVGSREEVTVRALARLVAAQAAHPGHVRRVPFDRVCGRGFSDPRVRRPHVARLEALTGWQPRRTLADAVADVVANVAAKHADERAEPRGDASQPPATPGAAR